MKAYAIVDVYTGKVYDFESDDFLSELKGSSLLPIKWLADQLHEEMDFFDYEKVLEVNIIRMDDGKLIYELEALTDSF